MLIYRKLVSFNENKTISPKQKLANYIKAAPKTTPVNKWEDSEKKKL